MRREVNQPTLYPLISQKKRNELDLKELVSRWRGSAAEVSDDIQKYTTR